MVSESGSKVPVDSLLSAQMSIILSLGECNTPWGLCSRGVPFATRFCRMYLLESSEGMRSCVRGKEVRVTRSEVGTRDGCNSLGSAELAIKDAENGEIRLTIPGSRDTGHKCRTL